MVKRHTFIMSTRLTSWDKNSLSQSMPFMVDITCKTKDDIFEDEHTLTAATQPDATEDPNNNVLQESATNKLPSGWGH